MKKTAILILILILITSLAYGADRSIAIAGKNSDNHKRVALVIGNGKYQYTDFLPRLANPPHDAEDIAAALRKFGFDVVQKNNLSREDMDSAIAEFGRNIGNSEAALFYFAGHGLQVKGQNYLIPVDVKIESEAQLTNRGININQLLDEMENSNSRANIVMLDACRNNPISGKFRSGATRGLAAPSSQSKNTIIVYATGPGNVAADGNGRNGLFTAGLLTAFKGSDLSLGGVLERASEEVERGSKQQQQPFISGPATLQKTFQFAAGKTVRTARAETASALAQPEERLKSDAAIEQETWESARASKNRDAIQEYIKQYPNGRFVGQAKVLIATLTSAEPKSPSITSRIGSMFASSSQTEGTAQETAVEEPVIENKVDKESAQEKKRQEKAATAERKKQAQERARIIAEKEAAQAQTLREEQEQAQAQHEAQKRAQAEELERQERERAQIQNNKSRKVDFIEHTRQGATEISRWRNQYSATTMMPVVVATLLVDDVITAPFKTITYIATIKEASVHPSEWGKPDSMIARASQQRKMNSYATEQSLPVVAAK